MGRKAISKNRKNNSKKREDWVLELFKYFQENGIKKVSMDEVANSLSKSKSTLYEYFESKDEIVALMLEMKLKNLIKFSEILTDTNIDFFKRYELSMAHISKELSDVSKLFFTDLKELYPSLWNSIELFSKQGTSLLENYYKEGISKGYFRKIDIQILTMTDNMFFNALMEPENLNNMNLTLKEALVAFLDLKMNGLKAIN